MQEPRPNQERAEQAGTPAERSLPVLGAGTHVTEGPPLKCPDCPAASRGVFEDLLPGDGDPCGMQRVTLEARAAFPPNLFEGQAFALVRRGIVVRQRADPQQRVVSIDVAGPGAYLPLGSLAGSPGSIATGYAASDALLCLYAQSEPDRSLDCLSQPTALELVRLQQEAVARLERLADARSRSTVQRRVAALLCALADTLSPQHPHDTVPALSLRDLAGLIQVRHESLCRELGKLVKRGLIRRSLESITLIDRSGLETL